MYVQRLCNRESLGVIVEVRGIFREPDGRFWILWNDTNSAVGIAVDCPFDATGHEEECVGEWWKEVTLKKGWIIR